MSHSADPRELFRRFEGNPILRPHDFPKMVNAVFNPGATVFDGRTLLLLRVEYRTGLSSLVAATSEDGLTGWEIDPVRGLHPTVGPFRRALGDRGPADHPGRRRVLRRLRRVLGRWAARLSGHDPRLHPLGAERCPPAPRGQGRRAVPDDLRGPVGAHPPASTVHVRVGRSHVAVVQPRSAPLGRRPGAARRHAAVGGGTPTRSGSVPRRCSPRMVGCSATTGCGSPRPGRSTGSAWPCSTATTRPRVLARGNEWVFGPHEPYEQSGDVPDVVFPCGWMLRDDGDTLHLYYGAADSVVCVAEASLATLLSHLEEHPYPTDEEHPYPLDTAPRPPNEGLGGSSESSDPDL